MNGRRLVVANPVPQLATTRLTFTYPLNAARATPSVTGADKAPALRGVLGAEGQRLLYPSQGVRPRRGEVTRGRPWIQRQREAFVPDHKLVLLSSPRDRVILNLQVAFPSNLTDRQPWRYPEAA